MNIFFRTLLKKQQLKHKNITKFIVFYILSETLTQFNTKIIKTALLNLCKINTYLQISLL